MQRKTKSVIACGMAAALMLTTLGMENEVSAKAAPKMQTKVLSLKKGQKKTIRIKGKGILKTTWKTTKKVITLTKNKPLCSGRTDEADYHFRGYLFYQVPEMEPSDAGRRRHGDTYCRPFEEKGDG